MDNPRECALDVLIKVDKKEQLSHIAIGDVLEKYQFSPKRDRAFFTRLVEGTLERQITIDYIINQFSKTKIHKCKPLIRALLRMGTYQILYMDQVPDSAACNESVKLAKKRGFSRLSGFVNGVLRNIGRQKQEIKYPSKQKDWKAYISVTYSLPQWLVEFFHQSYDEQTVEKIAASYLEEGNTTLCCMISNGSKEELKEALRSEGVTVQDGALVENAVRISDYDFLYKLKSFREGRCIVQDESSMLVGALAGVEKGMKVLDVCSAPGGKALYVADLMQGTGEVIARDLTEYKTDFIEENIDRTGLSNIHAEIYDARVLDEDMIGQADIVIADLPCSGLGIMGKKNDIKYNMTEESLHQLASLQKEILTNAVQYVKPGGILMYSTCTIHPEENEENFQWIQKMFPFHPVSLADSLPKCLDIATAADGYIQLLPGVHPCDGFFIGKLRRENHGS